MRCTHLDYLVSTTFLREEPCSRLVIGEFDLSTRQESRDAEARQLTREMRASCSIPRIPSVLSATWRHHSRADRASLEYQMPEKCIRRRKRRTYASDLSPERREASSAVGLSREFSNGSPADRQCNV